jgi:hypothetical protein
VPKLGRRSVPQAAALITWFKKAGLADNPDTMCMAALSVQFCTEITPQLPS